SDRRLADARARIAAANGLADDERTRWSSVVDSLQHFLDTAGAALQAKVGTTVDLRDKRGVGFSGKLGDEGDGQFRRDKPGGPKLGGLKVADLGVDSLRMLAPAGGVAERDRLLASWYFSEAKTHADRDAELAAGGDDPVVAHLRSLRDEERAGAAAK